MYKAEYYQKDDGSLPVEEYILSLDYKMKAKVLRTISLLEEYGARLGAPYSKYLRDGIFELRIKQSSNSTRVLYFFFEDRRIILTNGFTKKTLRTPRSEFKLAKDRREHFLRRGQ
jgi:phage-related protein